MLENGPKSISSEDVAVSKGAVAYSAAVDLCDLSDFALEYKVDCTGTPNVKLEIQQKSEHASSDWATSDTTADINSSVTDKNQHNCRLAPVPVRYARIKITELTDIVTDTVVTLRVSAQKKFAA